MKFFSVIMWLLGLVYHGWTAIIAFKHSVFAGVVTLVLPFISEVYWFFKMIGENTPYVILSIVFTILAIIHKITSSIRY